MVQRSAKKATLLRSLELSPAHPPPPALLTTIKQTKLLPFTKRDKTRGSKSHLLSDEEGMLKKGEKKRMRRRGKFGGKQEEKREEVKGKE